MDYLRKIKSKSDYFRNYFSRRNYNNNLKREIKQHFLNQNIPCNMENKNDACWIEYNQKKKQKDGQTIEEKAEQMKSVFGEEFGGGKSKRSRKSRRFRKTKRSRKTRRR
jgi:hypothetical protein